MRGLKKIRSRFKLGKLGQSTTEYILILAVVVMIAVKFRQKIGDQIEKATEQVGGNIGRVLDQSSDF